jgi:hypothetical protein
MASTNLLLIFRLCVFHSTMDQSQETCLICYEQVKGRAEQVFCSNSQCLHITCAECVKQYIASVSPEGGSLACPRTECSGLFDSQSMNGKPAFSKKDLELYYEGLLKNVVASEVDGRVIQQKRTHLQVIKDIRASRQQFFAQLPLGLQQIINVTHAKKKNRVDSRLLQRQEERIAACTKRKCLNDFCEGQLDKNHICCKCDTTFCKECEHPVVQGIKHVCNEKDKESIAFINTLTACPKCGVRVQKAEGCMSITCAVCQTNFLWNTGQVGGGGNHGQSTPVMMQASYTPLSVEFEGQLRGSALLEIKNLEEIVASDLLKKLHDKMHRFAVAVEGDKKRLKAFADAFSAYTRQKSHYQDSMKSLLSIRRVLMNDRSLVISGSISEAVQSSGTGQSKRKAEGDSESAKPPRLVRVGEGAACAFRKEEKEEEETDIETEKEED